MLALVYIILGLSSVDAAEPLSTYSQNFGWDDQQPTQHVQTTTVLYHQEPPILQETTTLRRCVPLIATMIATPLLAFVGVKLGSSVWFQSSGIAHIGNQALERVLTYYPNAPRNMFALLISGITCTTVALIHASGLRVQINFVGQLGNN